MSIFANNFLTNTINPASSLCLPILLSFSLLGCNDTVTDTAAPADTPIETHSELEHDEHDHEAHEHDEHEHDHDEHDHDEHDHDEHDHDEHDHDEHDHDEHDHDEHDHDEHDHEGHEGHDHDAHATKYTCTPDKTLAVYYNHTSQPRTAHLLIDGIEYDLNATTTNKDAHNTDYTYLTDIGLDETHGLVWQTTQDSATLKTPELDKLSEAESETPAFECHKMS